MVNLPRIGGHCPRYLNRQTQFGDFALVTVLDNGHITVEVQFGGQSAELLEATAGGTLSPFGLLQGIAFGLQGRNEGRTGVKLLFRPHRRIAGIFDGRDLGLQDGYHDPTSAPLAGPHPETPAEPDFVPEGHQHGASDGHGDSNHNVVIWLHNALLSFQ